MWASSSRSDYPWFIVSMSLFMHLHCSNAQWGDNDLIITQEQKDILDKFRDLVISKLPQDYMKSDIYLIRWLRARNYDIFSAEEMLMQNLQWRQEYDMEDIVSLDWLDLETEYPFILQGCDKGGSPVVTCHVGDWDVRHAVISGKAERLVRYFYKAMEETAILTRRAHAAGENLTQYSLIVDMDGYNLAMHGCPLCISTYIRFWQGLQNYYPGTVSAVKMINVPSTYLVTWNIIRQFLSGQTRKLVELHGKDKQQWKAALFKYIDPSELTTEFGGYNRDGLTSEDVSRNYHGPLQCSRLKGLRDAKGTEKH